jgi:hypothetical protein
VAKANGNNNGGNGQDNENAASKGKGNASSKGKGNAVSKGKGNKDEQDKRVGRIRKPPVSHTVQTYSLIFFLDILTYLVKFVVVRSIASWLKYQKKCKKTKSCWGKNDGKPARGRTRNLSDSARKGNRKEVLANYYKTRNNIGHQHDRWVELKEALRVQTHAEV